LYLSGSTEETTPAISTVHILSSFWPEPNQKADRRLALTYPRHGECAGHEATVRGFVEFGTSDPPKLIVDGEDASESLEAGGAFGRGLAEPNGRRGESWIAKIEVAYPDGELKSESVELGPCLDLPVSGQQGLSEDLGAPLSAVARAHAKQRIVLGTATLD